MKKVFNVQKSTRKTSKGTVEWVFNGLGLKEEKENHIQIDKTYDLADFTASKSATYVDTTNHNIRTVIIPHATSGKLKTMSINTETRKWTLKYGQRAVKLDYLYLTDCVDSEDELINIVERLQPCCGHPAERSLDPKRFRLNEDGKIRS